MKEYLYFVALVVPEPLQSEITRIKSFVVENFKSRKALNSPAHITLVRPFKSKDTADIEKRLSTIAQSQTSFRIQLDGYGFFKSRVVYIRPKENKDLYRLKKEVQEEFEKNLAIILNQTDKAKFSPHITIGFRDLTTTNFHLAKNYFKKQDFKRDFEVGALALLRHNGKNWKVLKSFPFNG